MKIRTRARFTVTGTLAVALATAPAVLAEEPDVGAAARAHFAAKNGSAAPTQAQAETQEAAKSSPEAMVSFFLASPPAGVTVASRKHVDLDVKFAFDSADLDETGIAELDVAGKALQSPQLKTRNFVLAGHTDDQGDEAYNVDLSKRRARAARQYLIEEYGIEPERLDAVGYGADQPRFTDGTPEARRANRRVVLEMMQ